MDRRRERGRGREKGKRRDSHSRIGRRGSDLPSLKSVFNHHIIMMSL